MVASTDIKFYVHTNTNAPQLQNAYGCMIDVLDACLVNGFGSQTVSTLTASGTIVTASFGSAHNFMQYQVIKIVGANQSEFNGEHRILTVPNSTSITFQLANIPSVTNATGTVSCSLPSLGWLRPFSATGKAAYRSANTLLSSRPFLRVVDALDPVWNSTYSKYAKVGIVEDMSDIDTMFGAQAPYDAANPDKNWIGTGSGTTAMNGWAKWYYARGGLITATTSDVSTTVNGISAWIMIGNSDYFYIFPRSNPGDSFAHSYGFGLFKSLLNADNSNTFLSAFSAHIAANSTGLRSVNTGLNGTGTSQVLLLQRGYQQSTQFQNANTYSLNPSNSTIYSGAGDYIGAYSLANISPLAPVFINESVLRGELEGIFWLLQNKPYNHLDIFSRNGSAFVAVNIMAGGASSQTGQLALKIGEL